MLPLTRQNILIEGLLCKHNFQTESILHLLPRRLYADKFLEFLEVVCDPSIRLIQIFFFLQLHKFYDHTRSLSSDNVQADRLRTFSVLVNRAFDSQNRMLD